MKRPLGATILAICLGSIAISQLATLGRRTFWPLSEPEHVVEILAAVAAVVAGVAAIGLWRLRPWAFKAVVAFGALIVALATYDAAVIKDAGLFDVTLLLVIQGLFFGLMARYVHWMVRPRVGNELPLTAADDVSG